MAISFKQIGTLSFITADATLVPSSMSAAAGDRFLLLAGWKDYSVTAALTGGGPGGWTKVTEYADGTVAQGNGTGSMKAAAWYRDWQSGDTDPTIDFSVNPNIAGGVFHLWQKGASDAWAPPTFVTAAWPSQSSGTVSASATVDIPDGAAVICVVVISDDSATFTRPTTAISDAAGAITWAGDYVEMPSTHGSSTTNNDMAIDIGYRLVTTGAAGVTLRTTISALSAAETGAVLWIVQGLQQATALSSTTTDALGLLDSTALDRSFAAIADTVGATDGITVATGFGRSAIDAVGLVTDSVALDAGRGQTDLVGVTDASAMSAQYVRSQTDAVGLSDPAIVDAGRTTADAVGITDALATVATGVRAQTDPVDLSDSATAVITSAGNAAAIDLLDITDALAIEVTRTTADLVGVTDSVVGSVGYPRTATDLVGVTDSVSATLGAVVDATDAVNVSDATLTESGRTATDAVGLLDTAGTDTAYVRTTPESVGITDSATYVIGGAITTQDLVGITDTVALTAANTRTQADPVAVADAATFELNFARAFTDPVGVADSATFSISATGDITAADPVNLTDAADRALDAARSTADAVATTDLAAITAAYLRGFTDPVGVTDSADFFITGGIPIADEHNTTTIRRERASSPVKRENVVSHVRAENVISPVR